MDGILRPLRRGENALIEEKLREKLSFAKNAAARKACELAVEKKTNLCLSPDEPKKEDFMKLLNATVEELLVFKTHVDIIEEWDESFWGEVTDICKQNSVMIFEDRKFADIGKTIKLQYSRGIYRIVDWAHIVNVHAVPGDGAIEGLQEAAKEKSDGMPRGALLLAQMTGNGTLATGDYMRATVEMAKRHEEFCAGFIGNGAVASELKQLADICPKGMLLFTPGVQTGSTTGALGQQYATPQEAVAAGSDFIIVGSGIYKATDQKKAAQEYRKAGWMQ